jgi:hypothetical protein
VLAAQRGRDANPSPGHRADTHDYLEPRGEPTFALAIEAVLEARVDHAQAATTQAAVEQIQTAGSDAAAAVQ